MGVILLSWIMIIEVQLCDMLGNLSGKIEDSVCVCVCICIWKSRMVNAGLPRECSAVWITKFQGHRELTSALRGCMSVHVSVLRRSASNQIHIRCVRSKVSPEKVWTLMPPPPGLCLRDWLPLQSYVEMSWDLRFIEKACWMDRPKRYKLGEIRGTKAVR